MNTYELIAKLSSLEDDKKKLPVVVDINMWLNEVNHVSDTSSYVTLVPEDLSKVVVKQEMLIDVLVLLNEFNNMWARGEFHFDRVPYLVSMVYKVKNSLVNVLPFPTSLDADGLAVAMTAAWSKWEKKTVAQLAKDAFASY